MIPTPGIWPALSDAASSGVYAFLVNEGAPTNGTSGTGAGIAGKGCLLLDTTNIVWYYNTNTLASPTWTAFASSAGGANVTLTGTQTLTNKTLTAPTVTGPTITGTIGGSPTITTPVLNQPVTLDPLFSGAAAGSTQADGVAITLAASGIAYITGANATKGAVLPVGAVGQKVIVVNDAAANAVLKLYGNVTDSATINGVAGSTAYSMAAKTSVMFVCVALAKWQTLPLVAS